MIYAIGDIHGQCKKLNHLLETLKGVGLNDEDLLVFLGDYVDRGPDVRGVIETLISLRDGRPNTVFLRGNHEQMLMDAHSRFDPSFDNDNSMGNNQSGIFWFVEGGAETLKSYGPADGRRWFNIVPQSHWDFIRSTQLEFHAHEYIFVHAGILPPGVRWSMTDFEADPRLWIRYDFIGSKSDFGGNTVIFGHTPTHGGKPLILENKVAIDTGAGHGGPLTAVRVPQPYDPALVEFWQA